MHVVELEERMKVPDLTGPLAPGRYQPARTYVGAARVRNSLGRSASALADQALTRDPISNPA